MGGSSPKQQTTTTTQKTEEERQTAGTSAGTTAAATTGAQDVALPEYLQSLIQGIPGVAGTALQDLQAGTQGFQLPPETLDTLRSYAGGDFLFGGPQMDAFTQAAQRAAMPGIYSQFGAAGRGGGGLESVALGQAGIDAYARLFPQQQQFQLQAAELLPKMQSLPLALQQQLLASASSLPGAFSPLFGQRTSGTSAGTTSGTTTENMTGQSSSVGTQTQPIYQTPWWQTALGGASALAGLAMPGLGGTSALGNLGSGLFGSNALQGGGLLGLFR